MILYMSAITISKLNVVVSKKLDFILILFYFCFALICVHNIVEISTDLR